VYVVPVSVEYDDEVVPVVMVVDVEVSESVEELEVVVVGQYVSTVDSELPSS